LPITCTAAAMKAMPTTAAAETFRIDGGESHSEYLSARVTKRVITYLTQAV